VVYAKTMRTLTTEPEIDLTFATSAARGSAAAVQERPLKPVLGRWCQRTCLECGDGSLHRRVDVGVVEVGERAVFLEGG
jgi:hypothetical protein